MRLVFTAMSLMILFAPAAALGQDSSELKSLLDDAWEFGLREDPTFATRVGDHRFNDKLSRESIADQQRRQAAKRELLARWKAIERAALSKPDRINYDIFGRILRDDITESEVSSDH